MAFQSKAALLVLLSFSALAQAQPVVQDGILTDPAGRTLYVFDKDQPNVSHCKGGCLQAWPAYTAEPESGAAISSKASLFQHDGIQQWAWNGKPLYYFVGDAKPGDRNGDGSGNVWHIVKPAPASSY